MLTILKNNIEKLVNSSFSFACGSRKRKFRQTWRKHFNSNQDGVMGFAAIGFSLGTMTEDKLIQSKIDEESRDIIQIEKPDFGFGFKVDDDVYVTHNPSNHNIVDSTGSLAPIGSKTTF